MYIEDLGSANGVRLNDSMVVGRSALKNGDIIRSEDTIEKAGMGVDNADLTVGLDRCIVDEIGEGNTSPHGDTTFLPLKE